MIANQMSTVWVIVVPLYVISVSSEGVFKSFLKIFNTLQFHYNATKYGVIFVYLLSIRVTLEGGQTAGGGSLPPSCVNLGK